jgi:serine/threonine protein kinase/formylglycine-generating enzyme required for sulfatase activity
VPHAQDSLETLVEQFEQRWLCGERPGLDAFLEGRAGASRLGLLVELVHIELEFRLKAGETARVEDYLSRYPELDRADIVQALAATEHRHRQRREPDLKWAEYASRFSALGTVPAPPPVSAVGRSRAAPFSGLAHPDLHYGRQQPTPTEQACSRRFPRYPELTRVGRYRVERILGEGTFGIVYLARDDELERAVAIKVPQPRRLARPGDAEAYLREARIVASLRHQHIVRVFDFGRTEDGVCYIVSEYLEGGSLADLLKQRRPSAREAAALVADLADALHHAHGHRLVHRDVKPGNILLDPAGKAYLTDFGMALRDEDLGTGDGLAGTPWYMSPEQARGENHRVDGRADIYSLGAVLYEMLAGQPPFRCECVSHLLEDIALLTLEAQPPRELVTDLPRELERVCLRALAKRASERYPSADVFADDLRAFLAQQTPPSVTSPAGALAAPGSMSTFDSTGEPSSQERLARVVPKGLRAFDASDKGFFLELLPGPRDRHGLPDSIRFWQQRIEATDAEQTFSVGLLYGPSGCGKSSLVRAGLLPRLGGGVLAVYVEAATGQTEARLVRGMTRHCPELASCGGLVETLAALRRGEGLPAGCKVLLVLDQFEQYLHVQGHASDTELVRGLRQCDGGRVQALLLVRDDFWLAVTRFLAELEVDLVQGHNVALVDLFDTGHARKVLAAFGRAHGRLADDPGRWSRQQQAFLDQTVEGLARGGRVIPVRLALFAEMVKGRPWEPASLRAVGGTDGVGVAFLEESFSGPSANPQHRLQEKAVRGVLRALLPERGTDIKGAMRSAAELEAASGYARWPKEFADLVRVLDGELRLVTPTDPEGLAEELATTGQHLPAPAAAVRYYQLTHDYLVPAVREWLTRKQKETRRGRAELRLAERASLWEARHESRQLPAWWEWLNIRLLTRRRQWTEPQQQMMRQATRHHALRGAVLAATVAIGVVLGLAVRHRLVEQYRQAKADDLVQSLLHAELPRVPEVIDQIGPYRDWADGKLRHLFEHAADGSPQRQRAALALLPVDPGLRDGICERMLDADPQDVSVLSDCLAPHAAKLRERLWEAVERPEQGKEARRLRAACALAAYGPGDERRWEKASGVLVARLVGENPAYLSYWIKGLEPVKDRLTGELAAVFCNRDEQRVAERALAASVLVEWVGDRPELLTELTLESDARQYRTLLPAVMAQRTAVLRSLRAELAKVAPAEMPDSENDRLAQRQANAAVTLLHPGESEPVWPLLEYHPETDPSRRSYLLNQLAPYGVEVQTVLQRLEVETDVGARRALMLSLGGYRPEQVLPAARQALVARLLWDYREHADPGTHGAARWLLAQWHEEGRLCPIDGELAFLRHLGQFGALAASPNAGPLLALVPLYLTPCTGERAGALPNRGSHWYVNGQGQTFTVITGPVAFRMGSPESEVGHVPREALHVRQIPRSYAIATRPVTVAEFQRFLRANPGIQKEFDAGGKESILKKYSPAADGPMVLVDWYTAAKYCNWLSLEEGLPETQWVYPKDPSKIKPGMEMEAGYLRRTGYRLPTEAEWEYVCRAGAGTIRYYGQSEQLLGEYAWYMKNSGEKAHPLGQRKPNDLGLFDMHGNVWEWCQDRSSDYPESGTARAVEDEEDRDRKDAEGRILRGGSFGDRASNVRSASRNENRPAGGGLTVGFRVVRTYP